MRLMTLELTMVVYAAVLLFIMIGVQGGVGLLNNGLKWGGGARDEAAKPTVLHGRATRAVRNHIEALSMFVPIVLVLNAAGISSEATVLWTKIFVGARVAYAVLYWFGTPWARTLVWTIGLVATLMLFIQAF